MQSQVKKILASSMMLGTIILGGALVGTSEARPNFATLNSSETRTESVHQELGTFAKLAKELNPSVVNISVVGTTHQSTIPEGMEKMIPPELLPKLRQSEQQFSGQGSGVIISKDGEILTNNHVVERADKIKVALFDGREFDADVIGTDPNTDLALLRLKEAHDLPVAKLGDSDQLAVGDWVMAIGNPFGLEATVTVGVLSGKGRVIGAGPYDDFLQTDASINPGNSGGPLFNINGEVVGINTAIIRGGQGIGFSIPINLAKDIAGKLETDGKVQRGFLGVGTQDLNPELNRALQLDPQQKGALVATVVPASPAEKAGLKSSDVIVSVAGKEIDSQKELLREIAQIAPGKETEIGVLRDGRDTTFRIKLDPRPDKEVKKAPAEQKPAAKPHYRVGVGVIDDQNTPADGVVVEEVLPNSPAAKAGIHQGDHIKAVGRTQVENSDQFHRLVDNQPKGGIALLVERNGRSSYLLLDGQ